MVKIYSEKEYIDRSGLPAKVLRIIGVPIYTMKISKGWRKHKYLLGLLKIREKEAVRQIYILGIKVWQRKDKLKELKLLNEHILRRLQEQKNIDYFRIARMTQKLITTALLHQKTFLPFKGCNKDKVVVLVAAGPTVNYYNPIKDAVHVGCNRALLKEDIKFDYLFTIDSAGIFNCSKEFQDYDCIKFVGDQCLGKNFQISEEFSNMKNTYRYKTNAGGLEHKFYLDIDSSPLVNAATVAIQAMQFILYTQPKKIFLVGVDCTVGLGHHFIGSAFDVSQRGESAAYCDEVNIKYWKELKNFAETYYSNTDIVSINPVRLKGVFQDVYTQSYLDSNSEIKEIICDDVKIL